MLVVAIAKEAQKFTFGKHSSWGNIAVLPANAFLGALFLSAFGVSLRRQEEKASGTAKAALQA